jgi:hypothetical protein
VALLGNGGSANPPSTIATDRRGLVAGQDDRMTRPQIQTRETAQRRQLVRLVLLLVGFVALIVIAMVASL